MHEGIKRCRDGAGKYYCITKAQLKGSLLSMVVQGISQVYFNHPEVQKPWLSRAFLKCTSITQKFRSHGCPGHFSSVLQSPRSSEGNNCADFPLSMLPMYKELIAGGIKIWVFSGNNTDAVVPVAATRYSIEALMLSSYRLLSTGTRGMTKERVSQHHTG